MGANSVVDETPALSLSTASGTGANERVGRRCRIGVGACTRCVFAVRWRFPGAKLLLCGCAGGSCSASCEERVARYEGRSEHSGLAQEEQW